MPAKTQPSRTSVRAKPLVALRAAMPVGRATTAAVVGSTSRCSLMVISSSPVSAPAARQAPRQRRSMNRSGGRLFEMNSHHLTEHLDDIDGGLARGAVHEKALQIGRASCRERV